MMVMLGDLLRGQTRAIIKSRSVFMFHNYEQGYCKKTEHEYSGSECRDDQVAADVTDGGRWMDGLVPGTRLS